MFHRLLALLGAGALCVAIATPRAEAASFTFTKIADTNTPMPGGSGNFAFFGIPVLDGSSVVFNGSRTCCPIQTGVYAGAGGSLQTLADFGTPVPGGTGNFSFFGDVAASGGTIAFQGDNGTSPGVYAGPGGSLAKVADTNTPIPGGVGNFQSFGIPLTVDSGRVAFVGTGSSLQRGVYSSVAGSLTLVADTSTAIPGGTGNFAGFFSPSARGGDLAFGGFDHGSGEGLYTVISGALAKAVDTNTPMPGSGGNFVHFGSPVFDGVNIAFIASDAFTPVGGYVVGPGGAVTLVAEIPMPAPGGTGNFTFFGGDPSISGSVVSFAALDADNKGALYRAQGGVLTRIVGAGDVLDGKVVSGVGVRRQASNGTAFAFYATFDDGSQGIFLATEAVPTDVFLHNSGSSLVLNGVAPTAATAALQDSAALKFSGGNPWKAIGTWSATAAFTAGTLDSLSPVHAWLGLKSTDDNGTRFDLRAEVLKNGVVVGSGEILCITGVVRDPALALEVSVPFGAFAPTPFNGTTDVLALRVLARIGTNGSGGACGGHGSAGGLRLYFDAVSRPSRFDGLLD